MEEVKSAPALGDLSTECGNIVWKHEASLNEQNIDESMVVVKSPRQKDFHLKLESFLPSFCPIPLTARFTSRKERGTLILVLMNGAGSSSPHVAWLIGFGA